MKVVIIYDDFACAEKAKTIFQRAAHRADGAMHWVINLWRTDLFSLPSAADTALADAADAHLILFGLKNIQQLPNATYEWLERWVALRRVQESALAVWVDGEVLSPEALAVAPISHFAKRYGLSFIHEAAGSIDGKSSAFARRDVVSNIRHVTGSVFYQKHGINE